MGSVLNSHALPKSAATALDAPPKTGLFQQTDQVAASGDHPYSLDAPKDDYQALMPLLCIGVAEFTDGNDG